MLETHICGSSANLNIWTTGPAHVWPETNLQQWLWPWTKDPIWPFIWPKTANLADFRSTARNLGQPLNGVTRSVERWQTSSSPLRWYNNSRVCVVPVQCIVQQLTATSASRPILKYEWHTGKCTISSAFWFWDKLIVKNLRPRKICLLHVGMTRGLLENLAHGRWNLLHVAAATWRAVTWCWLLNVEEAACTKDG